MTPKFSCTLGDVKKFCQGDESAICPAGAKDKFKNDMQKNFEDFVSNLEKVVGSTFSEGFSKGKGQNGKKGTQEGGGGPQTVESHWVDHELLVQQFKQNLYGKLKEIERSEIVPIVEAAKTNLIAAIERSHRKEADKKSMEAKVNATVPLTFTLMDEKKLAIVKKIVERPDPSTLKKLMTPEYQGFMDESEKGVECIDLTYWMMHCHGDCSLHDRDYDKLLKDFNQAHVTPSKEMKFNNPKDFPYPVLKPKYVPGLMDHTQPDYCNKYIKDGVLTDAGKKLAKRYDEYKKMIAMLPKEEEGLLADYQNQKRLREHFREVCGDYGMRPTAEYYHYLSLQSELKGRYLIVCPGLLIGTSGDFEQKKKRLTFVLGHELSHSARDPSTDADFSDNYQCTEGLKNELKHPEFYGDMYREMSADELGSETVASSLPLKDNQASSDILDQLNGKESPSLLARMDAIQEASLPLCPEYPEGEPGDDNPHPSSAFRRRHFILEMKSLRNALGCSKAEGIESSCAI